jgi:hypothetical protein
VWNRIFEEKNFSENLLEALNFPLNLSIKLTFLSEFSAEEAVKNGR